MASKAAASEVPVHCGPVALVRTFTMSGEVHVSYRCQRCGRKVGPFLDQRALARAGVVLEDLPLVASQLRDRAQRRATLPAERGDQLRAFWASALGQAIKARHRQEREAARRRREQVLPTPRLVRRAG